ncbi:MAG: V-type ATP synthase subunit C [Methanobacteriaceae archaeon]
MAVNDVLVSSIGLSSFGLSDGAFLALIMLIIVIVGAVVVVIVSRPVLDIFPYVQPNARVRARKGRLFDEKQISEIVEADNITELTNYLRGIPDYAKHVENYPLEKALDMQMAETYDLLSRIAPKNIQKTFVVMAKKSDISNIKSLITAKAVGLDNKATLNLLVPGGKLFEDLERLVDTNNVTDVVAGLEGTEYASILEDALPQFEESGIVLPLESALDKYYFERILRASSVSEDENGKILHSYVGSIVDIANLKLILRAKADNLNYESTSPYIVNKGYQLREWKLKDLAESEDVVSVVNSLEGTDYGPILNEALSKYSENASLEVFEKALDTYIIDTAHSLSLRKPLGIGPIIGFLSKKEIELRNLKMVIRAKRENNFPVSAITEMLM